MDIRAQRLAAGMTQAALARAAQVAQPNLSAYENHRRMPTPDVMGRIQQALRRSPSALLLQNRQAVLDLVERHQASAPRVFGSVARGDDHGESDLDLLVDFAPGATLFDEVGLRVDLEELLNISVDVVAADSLRPEVRSRVFAEARPL